MVEEDILLRDERKLFISRVPKEIKEKFIELANAEFTEDYGLTLKWIFEQAVEYQQMKILFFENMNYKLDIILENISGKRPEKTESIALLSGKKIERGKVQ